MENVLNFVVEASPASVPSVPLNLMQNPATSTEVTVINLQWEAPDDDGGSEITGYLIYWGTPPSTLLGSTTNDVLTYRAETDSPLTPGMSYTFIVVATNAIGRSEKSNSVTLNSGSVPSAPLNFVIDHSDRTEFTFSWTPPMNNGGLPLDRYEIYWDSGSGS